MDVLIGKSEKIARADAIRRMFVSVGTHSDCLEFAVRE